MGTAYHDERVSVIIENGLLSGFFNLATAAHLLPFAVQILRFPVTVSVCLLSERLILSKTLLA
jgi:hypothetical protein